MLLKDQIKEQQDALDQETAQRAELESKREALNQQINQLKLESDAKQKEFDSNRSYQSAADHSANEAGNQREGEQAEKNPLSPEAAAWVLQQSRNSDASVHATPGGVTAQALASVKQAEKNLQQGASKDTYEQLAQAHLDLAQALGGKQKQLADAQRQLAAQMKRMADQIKNLRPGTY